jgi:SOS-response transcriptional repressor LexA
MSKINQTPADRLRAARIAAGFSSTVAAASSLGMSASTYRAHENGQNEFSPDQAEVYSKKFKVSAAHLLLGEPSPDNPALNIRLREAVAEAGVSPAELAESLSEQLGREIGEAAVAAMIAGTLQIGADVFIAALRATGASAGPDVAIALGEVDLSAPTPTYAGVVRAGLFLPVDDYFNQDDVHVPDQIRRVETFARAQQFVWEVAGDSMDELDIREGMWVVGADYGQYVDIYGDIESGSVVVVERLRNGQSEREITVKEVRFFKDRYELHPRSSNPRYKPIVVKHDHEADPDTEVVRIIAVVLSAQRIFAQVRRSR